MRLSVVSALYENLRLHSTCSEVRSKRRGGASLPFFFDTPVTSNGLSAMVANACSPSSFVVNLPFVAVKSVSR